MENHFDELNPFQKEEFQKSLNILLKHHSDNLYVKNMITKAFYYAFNAHYGTERESKEPYITHPIAVATYLDLIKADYETICAALLHDTIEDIEKIDFETIQNEFTPVIAKLVDGVTKVSAKGNDKSKNFRMTANKLILSIDDDPRIILIKLFDRLHNMRTLNGIQKEEKKQKQIAQTREVFIPLAQILSIYDIKEELEDIAFKYSHKDKHDELRRRKNEYLRNNPDISDFIENVKNGSYLKKVFKENGIQLNIDVTKNIEFQGKPYYEIQNLFDDETKNIYDFCQIKDLFRFYINTNNIDQCDKAYRTMNQLFRLVSEKDYISKPAINGYQGRHVIYEVPLSTGKTIFVQFRFRTFDMKKRANAGIASCWNYDRIEAKDHMLEFLKGLEFYNDLEYYCQLYRTGKIDDEVLYENIKTTLLSKRITVFIANAGHQITYDKCKIRDFITRLHPGYFNENSKYYINGEERSLDDTLSNNDLFEERILEKEEGISRVRRDL